MQGNGKDPERKTAHDAAPDDDVKAASGAAARVDETANDSSAPEAAGTVPAAGGEDMLDVVRQMIAEAEALPEPAPAPVREEVVPVAAPYTPSYPDFSDFNDTAPDDWNEDAGTPTYYETVEEGVAAQDAAPAPVRRSLSKRFMGWVGRLLVRLLRYVMRQAGRFLAWAWRHIWAFLKQPDAPRRLSVVVIVAAALTWPWFVLKIAFLFPLGILTLWAATGNNGFAELVTNWHAGLKEKDPDKAEKIRRAAAWCSRTIMRGADRLPSHWTSGFSLPDFEGSYAVPEKMKVDAFEDFAEKVRKTKQLEE